MKYMISQPMRGKTKEQILSEREYLVDILESMGHIVLDTVFAEGTLDDKNCLYYLAKSIEAMGTVDEVFFMDGWEEARGCSIEYTIACAYGIPCSFESDLEV